MEPNQLFACYASQNGLLVFKSYCWKPYCSASTAPCQCHTAPQWAQYELYLWYETLGSYCVVTQTLVPCTIYKAGLLPPYHPLFLGQMPHCNTTAPAMELWEAIVKWLKACFAIVHVKGWISPVLQWLWQLVFSLYDLPMRDRLHDSTS